MIDEQKLLQWIEDKRYVYSVVDDFLHFQEQMEYKGCNKILNMLERAIELGEFNQE